MAFVCHAADMTSPSQLGALEDGVDALHLSPVEDLGVRDLFLPSDVEQPPETSHVKRVELLCVPAVNSPCLAGVEQGREDHGTVDLELGLKAEPSTLPDRAAESAKSCTPVCYPAHDLLINVGRTRQGAT